jgi:hypothetical protein
MRGVNHDVAPEFPAHRAGPGFTRVRPHFFFSFAHDVPFLPYLLSNKPALICSHGVGERSPHVMMITKQIGSRRTKTLQGTQHLLLLVYHWPCSFVSLSSKCL